MAKKVEYRIGPVIGQARNKTLAREEAEREAASELDRYYENVTSSAVFFAGAVAVIIPNRHGWGYKILEPGNGAHEGKAESQRLWMSSSYETREAAEKVARWQLAELVTYAEKMNDDTLENCPAVIEDEQDRASYTRAIRWQKAAQRFTRYAEGEGITDKGGNYAHDYACQWQWRGEDDALTPEWYWLEKKSQKK
jgi:hypothetical protein